MGLSGGRSQELEAGGYELFPNQDSPLLHAKAALLACDVWSTVTISSTRTGAPLSDGLVEYRAMGVVNSRLESFRHEALMTH
jgi:hypothetical protein